MSNGYQDYTKLKDNQWRHPSPSEPPALMNDTIKELAYKAGFALWENEEYRPPNAVIDWSCMYDDELVKFAESIVKECALIAGVMEFENRKNIGAAILDRFGVKNG
jgi:hypothetical protein